MNITCPNCGTAIVAVAMRRDRPEITEQMPPMVAGSMVLCGSCGDLFEFQESGLIPWCGSVPDFLARISSGIKMMRARRHAFGKAALN